ncbi:MAG: tyrosine-protein kinase [Chloroflexota bacterium]|nr:tyrosine-protein kinase [Chloroflexota bacterium]
MPLRRQLHIVQTWWPLLVGSVVLAAAGAFVVSSLQPRVYQAEATLIVGQSLSGTNPDYTALLVSQRLSTTYATVATTRPLLENVIKQLGLSETPEDLAKRVSAEAPLDSTLLTIRAEDGDPARAAALANALASQLISASPAVQGREADLQASVEAGLKATQKQIDAIQASVERLTALTSPSPTQVATLDTLQARLVSLRSTYASMLGFSSSNSSNLLSVVQPAAAPADPISPRPLLNTMLAAIVGLFVAGAIVLVGNAMNDTVRDPDDIADAVDLPTLGTIVRDGFVRGSSHGLTALTQPRSPTTEAYRSLRTNLEFASLETPLRSLLVTSSGPEDGKTDTAANLAIVFAQAGWRVLLIDADLRKPSVHTLFGVPNQRGLTTLLSDDELRIEGLIRRTDQDRLRILTSGPVPTNPAEIVGSPRMRALIVALAEQHDLVIVDSPPLQMVADPAILSSYLDGTVLVVGLGRSRRGAVRRGVEALNRAHARVLGVVLNGLSERDYSDYQSYYGPVQQADEPAYGPLSAATRIEPARPGLRPTTIHTSTVTGARPEARSEPRSELRSEPRSEPRTEPRSESRTEPRSEPRPEIRPPDRATVAQAPDRKSPRPVARETPPAVAKAPPRRRTRPAPQ